MELTHDQNEMDNGKSFVSLGALPVNIKEDNSVLIDVAGTILREGKFEISYSSKHVLQPTERRPLAALMDTSAGEARFEIGSARITREAIEMQLFGAPFLPVRFLAF